MYAAGLRVTGSTAGRLVSRVLFRPLTTYWAELDICRDDVCTTVFLDDLPTPQKPTTNPDSGVTLGKTPENEIAIVVDSSVTGGVDFLEGDVFRVTLRNSERVFITERSWRAMYKLSYPNGPRCPSCINTAAVTEL